MKSFLVEIKGVVQGVGFRPFVYNLALKYGINGWVNNDDTITL
jgi:hydrogenase maturation protein HypF